MDCLHVDGQHGLESVSIQLAAPSSDSVVCFPSANCYSNCIPIPAIEPVPVTTVPCQIIGARLSTLVMTFCRFVRRQISTPLSLTTSVAVVLVLTYPGGVPTEEVEECNVESRYFPVTLLILLPCRLLTLICA